MFFLLQINLAIFAITVIYFTLWLYTPNKAVTVNYPHKPGRKSATWTPAGGISINRQKNNNYFFLILFYTIKYTMCMLEEHSDALSLPSDVRRTSNFQKSVRSPAYKSSSKRTYAVRHKANEWQISPKALAAKGLMKRVQCESGFDQRFYSASSHRSARTGYQKLLAEKSCIIDSNIPFSKCK